MPAAASCTYHFGAFRLDPAARELWRDEALLDLPRLTFEGLAFLVENRDRAVSRDELISAVWGKPYVEDIQVTQLIMRLRRAIGDDSHDPRFVRTVPGFGYRWIAETEVLQVPETNGSAATGQAAAVPPSESGAAHRSRRFRLMVPAALVVVLVLLTASYYFSTRTERPGEPLPRQPGQAIAVLPLEVRAPAEADAAWVRLGAMDLIAGRLREAGLPVPPSDAVVAALHAVTDLPPVERDAALRRALGAGVLVEGWVSMTAAGWSLELMARTQGGDRRRVQAGSTEIIHGAAQAADLLLAALGRAAPARRDEDVVLEELLQRARAAMLALELDAARSILMQAPAALQTHPLLRHQLTWIEFYAGRLEQAAVLADQQLEDEQVSANPRLHAEALMLRGSIVAFDQQNWSAGAAYFDAAVSVLDHDPWAPELAAALARRGGARAVLEEFDAAARDLGRARTLYEVGGDRQGLARVHNYFANLEMQRRRPADARSHFRAANMISEDFGHLNEVRANLTGMMNSEIQMLRWQDALATSDQLWALRERIRDPYLLDTIRVGRAVVLKASGRLAAAERVLAEMRGGDADGVQRMAVGYEHVTARLAWEDRRWEDALHATARALAHWPTGRSATGEQLAEIALLHQRASIRTGRAVSADQVLPDEAANDDSPLLLVARAEWAAFTGDDDEAEHRFRQAAARAEEWLIPSVLATVSAAYARWLLTHDRIADALGLAGRVAGWAGDDYECALLQVSVFHASGQREAWAVALERARRLAGEREIPAMLLAPPAPAPAQ